MFRYSMAMLRSICLGTVYLLRQLLAVSQETGRQHWVIWCHPDNVRRHMVRVPSVCLGPQVGILSHLVLRTWTYPMTILNRSSGLIYSIRLQFDSYVTLTMGINLTCCKRNMSSAVWFSLHIAALYKYLVTIMLIIALQNWKNVTQCW